MTKEEQVGNLSQQPITQTLEKNYMPYAMSVIVSRAIPEIDGFKPSHRKLLYTMYKMGLLTGNRTKSANVVGQTMKLNPHGDQAIYETLVRLTRGNGAMLHPYIDSKGNFGRQYSRDMQYAASRYTEVRLDKICEEVFGGLDRNSVDFIDNYDGTMTEPMLLPTTFPAVLVNSNQGIAVGMASNICSFNLKEVCEATIAYIKDPGCDVLDIMPAPDFSTGAEIIYNPSDMAHIYKTGRGSIKLRATYIIDKKNSMIEIKSIPYTTTVEAVIDDISGLVKAGKIKDINDVRDETDLDGLKLAVEYKRSTDPEALMQKLFRFTALKTSFPCNFNILVNGTPRVLGVKPILAEWLNWRRACVHREIAFDLEKKQNRMHLLRGLEKILLDIDKAVRIVRETEQEADVIPNLMKGFDIDVMQAEYVAEIKLRQLNRQYILQRTKDIANLVDEISELRKTLENRERIDALIISQMQAVAKKYGKPRQTKLIHADDVDELSDHQLIEDYKLKVFLTDHGYLKKIALTSLRSAGELKTKDDDQIVQDLEGHNKSQLLLFSDRGVVYKMKCFDIADHKPSALGEYTPNLLDMSEDERIVFIHLTDDYSGNLIFGFTNGKAAKIPVSSYETKTNRKKLVNAYSTKSPLVAIHYMTEEADYVMISDIGKALIFNSDLVAVKATRSSQGVSVMTAKKGSQVVHFIRLETAGFEDTRYYRKRTIPAVGTYLKNETLSNRQLEITGL